jgi:hypothetical protein
MVLRDRLSRTETLMESELMLSSDSGFTAELQMVEMDRTDELLTSYRRCLRGLDRSALAGIDVARCLAKVLSFKVRVHKRVATS